VTVLRWLRPTILDRYVLRELWPPMTVGLLLFTFILLLDAITGLMRIFVSRGADLATIARAFAHLLPSIFSVTIPMAFLMGVLLAFGRLASDSEIVALRASGISPARLLRPVLALAALAGMVTFYVVAVALPVANQTYREIAFAVMVSKARTGVTSRVFNDDLAPGGSVMIYVSDIPAESGLWKDVFIHDLRHPQQPNVILARSGRLVIDEPNKRVELDLQKGTKYSFNASDATAFHQERFVSGQFPLPYDELFPKLPLSKGDRELTLDELQGKVKELKAQGRGRLEYGRFEVEYHKKFAIPAACLVFGLLGLGLSLGSKKEARSAAFGLAIAVIFVYYVIIRLGEQAGDTGMMPPILAMWGANLVLGALAVVLLVLNHREAAFDPLDPSHYKALLRHLRPRARKVAAVRPAAAVPGRRRPRPVVVLRIPRLGLPVPGLLDRYIARSYVAKFVMVLATFWALFVLVNFMDLFDDVQTNRVKGIVVINYYVYNTARILHLLTPVAVLVTVLITFGLLARHNEVTAMKAAGVSLYRAVLPAVALAGLIAFASFEAGEYLLPPLNKLADENFNIIKGRPPQSSTVNRHRWILGSDGRFYNYDYLQVAKDADPMVLHGLSVYDVDPQAWVLKDRIYAVRATWNGIGYTLDRSWRRTFGDKGTFKESVQEVKIRDLEPPSYFAKEERESDTLSFRELKAHISSLESLGLDVTRLRVELHRKIAFPTVSVIMTLIGVPFAFVVARKGALYGIAISVIIAIVYWACLAIFETLGSNAYLPPSLAAWTANLLFGAAGLYFLFSLET
jgi:LPS export ABC transporter permease LptG/LPS export ABC transporter permease LptF